MNKLDKPGLGATAGPQGKVGDSWGGTPGRGDGADRTQRLLPAPEDSRRPANSGGARTPGSDPAPWQHPEGPGAGAGWPGRSAAGEGPRGLAAHVRAAGSRRRGRGTRKRAPTCGAGTGGDWLARQARAPAVLTGGRLRPARPSPPCRVGDAAAPRGAGPPPSPRLCRRAGNFPAKVILQARPRPRSGGFGVGWTGDLRAAGAPGVPGPVGGCSAAAPGCRCLHLRG